MTKDRLITIGIPVLTLIAYVGLDAARRYSDRLGWVILWLMVGTLLIAVIVLVQKAQQMLNSEEYMDDFDLPK